MPVRCSTTELIKSVMTCAMGYYTNRGGETTQKNTKLAAARKTGAAAKNQEKNLEEDDEEEGDTQEDDPSDVEDEEQDGNMGGMRPRWTGRCANRLQGDGWDDEGKLFYEKVRVALKEIGWREWSELWNSYWDVEKENVTGKRSKKVAREYLRTEDLVEESDGEVMFGSSDEDELDGKGEEEGDDDGIEEGDGDDLQV